MAINGRARVLIHKSAFTPEQIAMMRRLVIEAEDAGRRVDWEYWRSRIGHPMGSIQTMAKRLRAEMRAEKARAA